VARGVAKHQAGQAGGVAPVLQAGGQGDDDRFALAEHDDIGAIGDEIVREEGWVDASCDNSNVRVVLFQSADLVPGHRVVGSDDREAHDSWAELGDQVQQTGVVDSISALVADTNIMAGTLEEGAQEADAQRVFPIGLLGVEGARNDEEHAH